MRAREQDEHAQGFGVPGWHNQVHNFPADGRDLQPGSEQGVLRHGAVGLPGERIVRRSGDERHHQARLCKPKHHTETACPGYAFLPAPHILSAECSPPFLRCPADNCATRRRR
jgi:hypothetical protein